jgi:hypothetical protein
MPEFVAQHVRGVISDLDSFTLDYLEAVEWLLDEEIDRDTIKGFSPETIAKVKEDCEKFQQANKTDLEAYQEATGYTGGVDLWLTRNHHGAGFWDRGLGDVGERLTDASRLGECDAYLGDDGFIYLYLSYVT